MPSFANPTASSKSKGKAKAGPIATPVPRSPPPSPPTSTSSTSSSSVLGFQTTHKTRASGGRSTAVQRFPSPGGATKIQSPKHTGQDKGKRYPGVTVVPQEHARARVKPAECTEDHTAVENQLAHELADARLELADARLELADARHELVDARHELLIRDNKASEREKTLAAQDAELALVRHSLVSCMEKVASLTQENGKLKDKLDEETAKAKADRDSLTEDVVRNQEECDRIWKEWKAAEKSFKEDRGEWKKKSGQLQQDKNQLQKERDQLQEERDQFRQERDTARQQMEILQHQFQDETAALEREREEADGHQATITTLITLLAAAEVQAPEAPTAAEQVRLAHEQALSKAIFQTQLAHSVALLMIAYAVDAFAQRDAAHQETHTLLLDITNQHAAHLPGAAAVEPADLPTPPPTPAVGTTPASAPSPGPLAQHPCAGPPDHEVSAAEQVQGARAMPQSSAYPRFETLRPRQARCQKRLRRYRRLRKKQPFACRVLELFAGAPACPCCH